MIPNFTFTMGYVFDSLLSYLLPDWRDFTLALSILTFPFVLFWPLWPKSPRWLFSVGRAKEGQEVVKLFAKDRVEERTSKKGVTRQVYQIENFRLHKREQKPIYPNSTVAMLVQKLEKPNFIKSLSTTHHLRQCLMTKPERFTIS